MRRQQRIGHGSLFCVAVETMIRDAATSQTDTVTHACKGVITFQLSLCRPAFLCVAALFVSRRPRWPSGGTGGAAVAATAAADAATAEAAAANILYSVPSKLLSGLDKRPKSCNTFGPKTPTSLENHRQVSHHGCAAAGGGGYGGGSSGDAC